VGIALLVVGFGFKVAAAPFHMWAPDVYEGAPTPITAYMAAAVKAAAFAAFFRLWLEAFPTLLASWHEAVWWLAALTMVVGNVVALAQRNIKRLLAYSSIAHAGYILVALVVGTSLGSSAFMFYLFAYTVATLGAFAVIVALGRAGEDNMAVEEYAGLWSVRPGLAVAMAVFMLALLGFPIFGGIGFFAKWYVLQAALQAPFPQTRLAVLLVITSVVSAGYYLYVVMVMFMKPRASAAVLPERTSGWTRAVVWGSAAIILIFGLFPDALVSLTQRSAPVVSGDIARSR
jgi:NADH-quinone oxidoreductase subunit N